MVVVVIRQSSSTFTSTITSFDRGICNNELDNNNWLKILAHLLVVFAEDLKKWSSANVFQNEDVQFFCLIGEEICCHHDDSVSPLPGRMFLSKYLKIKSTYFENV